jgi:hypothetical protein
MQVKCWKENQVGILTRFAVTDVSRITLSSFSVSSATGRHHKHVRCVYGAKQGAQVSYTPFDLCTETSVMILDCRSLISLIFPRIPAI